MPFRLCIKGEDRWGNPSNLCDAATAACAPIVNGRPPCLHTIQFEPGQFAQVSRWIAVLTRAGADLTIELLDDAG